MPLTITYIANVRMPTEKAHGFQISKMCEALAQAGADVELWHPSRRQSDPDLASSDLFTYYGCERSFRVRQLPNVDVFRIQKMLPESVFRWLHALHSLVWSRAAAKRARREGGEICYVRDPLLAFWLGLIGVRFFFEAHGVPRGARLRFLRRIARPGLLGVIALTAGIRDELEEMGIGPITVLPDAFDPEMFSNLPDRDECRRRLGIPVEETVIGYVGRFTTMGFDKGLEDLVRSLALVEGSPMLVCVGGPMDPVDGYRALARQLGVSPSRVRFEDRVRNWEAPLWMKASDVVTVPLRRSAFSEKFTSPLKVFEYMAAGCAIVASDLPALREILVHGENAWLVEPNDPEDLAGGLTRVLGDEELRRSLGERALQDVRRHTWHERARSVLELSASALGADRSELLG